MIGGEEMPRFYSIKHPTCSLKKQMNESSYILSDFQESDWQTAYSDLQNSGITYELIKVGGKSEIAG